MFDSNEFSSNANYELEPNIANILATSLQNTYSTLTAASKSNNFLPAIAPIFDSSGDLSRLQALSDSWASGDFSQLPIIQILPSNLMNGANGAFSEATRTIYLSSDYLAQNLSNPDILTGGVTGTLLEEIGHFVDTLLNPGADTVGDEGELFSKTLMGSSLSDAEKLLIQQEDDHSFITIDGNAIAVEQSLTNIPVISVTASDASAGETATGVTTNPGTFTLTRTGDLTTAVTVNYTLAGTATKGVDYSNLTGTVGFAAGASTTTVKVTPIDDTLAENSETAILTLKTGTGYTLGTTTLATITLADNETPVISVTATDASAGETATGVTPNPGTFTLNRIGNLATALTVNYTLAGTATKGVDYSNLTGTVSFASGASTATVKVTPTDDTLAEKSETVILSLQTGTGYTLGTTTLATITLADNETPVISVTATDASAGETATGVTSNPGTFTLTRIGNLATALTVNYTLAGTATKGVDYSNLTGTVGFAAGSDKAVVNFTPIDDILAEGNETVILALATGTGYTVGTTKTATVTIADNEVLPTQNILQGLSLTANIFTALDNVFAQNSLLLQKLDLLSKRIDIDTAKTFLGDAKTRLNQAIISLNSLSSLNLKTIVEQLSNAINNIGSVTVSVNGQLIASNLVGSVNLTSDSEVIFNFDFAKLFTVAQGLTGTKTLSLAGVDTNATITGNANGSGSLGFKLNLGIDKLGKAFVIEGGLLSAVFDLNTTLAGSASIKGLANGQISGTGKLNLNTQLRIDDGDTIANERLYLSSNNIGTLFAANGVSFAGGIVLSSATIKGSIANLSAFEIPIAATGSLNFVTGKAELTVQQDAILDALVNAAEKGISSLANQSSKVAQFTKNIPLIGSNLSTALASVITKGLKFDAPNTGTKAYLASRNIVVEKIITPQQFFSGNVLTNDVLLLRYNPSVSDTLPLANTSSSFDAGLAKFTLKGNLQATPNLALDLRFGIDLANGPFILEGGTIDAQLPIKGSFDGTANIGQLITGQVSITNAILNPVAKLIFSDFDTVTNERFYLLGSNNTLSLDNILGKKDAISLTGNLALDAALTIANINIPLLKQLNLSSFTWNASVQYDLVTGQANYTVKNDDSITAIASLFKGKQGDIINLFLGDLVNSNPIPKDIRTILTEKIPLLDKNLLDIIGAPKGLQLLINPDQFKGKTLQQINDKTGQQGLDILDLSLDLVKVDNVFNLLSGKDTNLISLDIKQTLASFGKKFTVLPSTTVFTFYGIAGVSVGVDIEAIISMLVDTTVGFDTQGFYVIESGAKAPSGRTVGNMLFSLNPTVTGIITGTLDIITVVPLIDIAGRVSLIGQLGLRLDDSPSGVDSDPKVRLSKLNDTNLFPTLKIDLGLGLTSTLFPIGDLGLPLVKKGEVEKIVPLYNKSAGSLADVKNDVKAFIDKTRGEGALKVYALGVITGDPTLLTAGTVLLGTSPQVTQAFSELATGLKESGRDMLGAAKDLALVTKTYGLKLGDTAKFLYENFTGGVVGVASALYKEVTQDISDIAKGLYNGVTQDLRSIARGLYDGVTTNLDSIAKGIYNGAIQDIGKIAKAIIDEFGKGFFFSLGNLVSEFLPDGRQIENYFNDAGNYLRRTFNSAGKLIEKIDFLPDGRQIENYFNDAGNYLRRTFNSAGKLIEKIDFLPDGRQIENYFNDAGNYLRRTFNSAGKLIEKIDFLPDGRQIENYFNDAGNYLRRTFNSAGKLIEKIDFLPDGRQIENYFNDAGNYLRRTFNSAGKLIEKIDFLPDGRQIENYFNDAGNYLRRTFNSAGKLIEKIDFLPDGRQIENYFNDAGNYLRRTFNSAGKLIEKIEWLGNIQKEFYYVEGQLNKYYEYVGGSLKKYWDTAQGWWDSAIGWLTTKPSWWPF
ncbi:Calx-beta domain-containing protein [Nostoc sp. TCL26-01]|uniref:beta strand repeat-containing protein n=1 Tax=Nostoc sp. TCL26-01 TaxID=2576904 RepID=UPI0015BE1719|nr:Calx-beta domain-containing protein [Nostoc sp. TCL26-01]QLE56316.1 hypothetical protein FD725_12665 [Nostoc sp. TCL26-01]